MKILHTLCLLVFTLTLTAQSSNLRLYQVMQEKCVSCHGSINPEAGLDLYGTGANESTRAVSVRNNLVNQTPDNDAAASAGYKLVSPGRIDQSHFFRKINEDFEPIYTLDEATEGSPCPKPGSEPLTEIEKELFRQWIFYGAPASGTVTDEDLIEDYYTNGGLEAFPEETLAPPAPGEGFQIKMGPFFLEPGGEVEYFQNWNLNMSSDKEVYRLEADLGTFSHHFLIYNFAGNGANGIPQGYRLNPNHNNVSLVAAVQEPTDLRLPQRTAWNWKDDLILDLNAHYINYDPNMVYKAECYLNIYTQDVGTAVQEMYTDLVVNPNIYIPNDGDLVIESQTVNPNYPAGTEIFLWSMTGHTHKYGTSYKVWDRNAGQPDELIYDASCPNAVPGCASPFYDYQHIPTMYFDDALYPLELTASEGFRHEARYINDGPSPVWFGPTSDDEMMVMIMMYVQDTTGLDLGTISSLDNRPPTLENVKVAPNPMTGLTYFTLPTDAGEVQFKLTDVTGKEVRNLRTREARFVTERGNLADGVYFYTLTAEDGRRSQGKLVVQKE